MLLIKKNKKTKQLERMTAKLASIVFISFESLFNIRPSGTLSKNSFRGEKSKLVIIDSWMRLDILGFENARVRALKNANTA